MGFCPPSPSRPPPGPWAVTAVGRGRARANLHAAFRLADKVIANLCELAVVLLFGLELSLQLRDCHFVVLQFGGVAGQLEEVGWGERAMEMSKRGSKCRHVAPCVLWPGETHLLLVLFANAADFLVCAVTGKGEKKEKKRAQQR